MTEEKKWLSADELAERWESPLINLYGFLGQGLPAYTDAGAAVVDTKDCTSIPRFTKNQLRQMNPIAQELIDWSDSPEAECVEEQQYEQWIDEVYNAPENWIMLGPKPNQVPMSFESPVIHTEIDEAASKLRRLKFKLDDILDFEKAHPVQPKCIFQIQGDHWHIVYLGNTLSPSRPIKVKHGGSSFRYVHQLISLYMQRGVAYEIKADQLENLVEGSNVSEYDEGDIDSTCDSESTPLADLQLSSDSYETIMDDKFKKEVKSKLDELNKQIEQCKRTGNEDRGEELEEERDNLLRCLSEVYGGSRNKRDINSSDATKLLDAARKRVSDQIHRSFKKIAKYDQSLHDHLKRYIKPSGVSWSYNPDRRIEWEV
ncbi:MAG: hypothetical protein ACLQVJ_24000 [Syntrophobacteraceae bacterium]